MLYIIYAEVQSLWILNVNNLGILSYKKQRYFISSKRLYDNILNVFEGTRKKYN